MRIQYDQPAGGGCPDACIISVDWRQEWFTNLCLSIILAITLFLMLLSIYLVFTKPAPALAPNLNPNQSGRIVGGAAFATYYPEVDYAGQVTSGLFLYP